jgi:hypothetical protein
MPRKNSNAGQPNRAAQIARRASRRDNDEQHRKVYGPGSPNLVRIEAPVRERVS